ncbi:MAG TPA: outer membrane beta-barrel protein [Candidatus Polarisedimenticolaceae bacterium]|nr:outer membrane beta-barrel protein [Candidatus Polarisedimenticolaceae bacterium]
MRRLLFATALLVSLSAAPRAQEAEAAGDANPMTGNVQFLLGQRWLGEEWHAASEPSVFGVEVDFAPVKSPVHVALSMQLSGDDSALPGFLTSGDVDVGFFEFSAGFLWLPVRKAVVRPYIGGGALTMAAATGNDFLLFGADEHDQSFGFYANAGVFFKVGDHFNIGVDGRAVRETNFELGPLEIDGDYDQVSFLIGFSWGP